MARRMGFFARLFFTYRLFIRLVVLGVFGWVGYWLFGHLLQPVTLGVAFPLSGPMATAGSEARDGALLAVAELNARGGVRGRAIETVEVDLADGSQFANERARMMFENGNLRTVVGCVRPHCRRDLYPIIESRQGMLIYPYAQVGMVDHPRVLDTGPLPNQLLRPGAEWAVEQLGKRVYLLLSDDLYGRVAEEVFRHVVSAAGGEVIGQVYLGAALEEGEAAARTIARLRPDVVLNTVLGEANIAFYKTLDTLVPRNERIPSLIFQGGAHEIEEMGWETLTGSFVIDTYFPDIEAPGNTAFRAAYARAYGTGEAPQAEFESAYTAVMAWAAAAELARSVAPDDVLAALPGLTLDGPAGSVQVAHHSRHFLHTPIVAEVMRAGELKMVWRSETPIEPQNYDLAHTPEAWSDFLANLYREWDNNWSPPE